MQTHDLDLFPTLVQVVEGFITQEQCNDMVNYAKSLEDKTHGAIPYNGISNHDINYSFLSDVEKNVMSCKFILNSLYDKLNSYAATVGYGKVGIDNSWVNFQYPNSKLLRHAHPDSVVSCALYLKSDEKSSKLFFYNPNQHIFFNAYKQFTKYSFHKTWFDATVGNLIIFPSWLMHGSDGEMNQSEERVVVSVNTKREAS